jgi:hypothetical protein
MVSQYLGLKSQTKLVQFHKRKEVFMKLIGCAGQARNGKDVTADYLALKLGWNRGAFASNVKKIFCDTFMVDSNFIEKWKTSKEVPDGFQMVIRKALQFIGDGFRQIKDEVWVEMLLNSDFDSMIISDIRYVNELKAVRQRGGINILIYRPGFMNDDPNNSEAVMKRFANHFIENKVEGKVCSQGDYGLVDFFIVNDSSLEDLYAKIDALVIPHLKQEAILV